MRLRLERYESANRSAQTRSLLAFVFGGIGLIIFGSIVLLSVAVVATPASEGGDVWSKWGGAAMGVFMGAVPMGISALVVAWGLRQRARFQRFGELAVMARQTPVVTTAQVAHALRLSAVEAERLVAEAVTLDFAESSPGQEIASASANASASDAVTRAAPNVAVAVGAGEVGPGTILGDAYRVEEQLGAGGMGVVFAARHLRTGRRYAVKTIRAGAKADEAAVLRFEREATAASELGHPGIVQVHDFNAAPGGTFYLVMDLLEGETLADRLDKTKVIAWSDAQRIAVELCAALGAAHDHGLLHRDIKPSNVFLTKSARASSGGGERVVLVDFGLVKLMAESATQLTNTGAVLGTPMYMSPEQARGEPLDIRSDLYSLAAVIFECVTGSPPFGGGTIAAIYARLLSDPPPRASQLASRPIPRALDDIFLRALAKERVARFPTARALGEALAAAHEDTSDTSGTSNSPVTRRMTTSST